MACSAASLRVLSVEFSVENGQSLKGHGWRDGLRGLYIWRY